MNSTAYTDLSFHRVKAAVLLNDSFNEMTEIDKFIFSMNERRFQNVSSSTRCNIYERRKMFDVATCLVYMYMVNICTYISYRYIHYMLLGFAVSVLLADYVWTSIRCM
jgi:hypothetical protein